MKGTPKTLETLPDGNHCFTDNPSLRVRQNER